MASFNKVMLMGNLTRDPVLEYVGANDDAVVNFGLAVNRKVKKGDVWEDDVCFVEIKAWRRQAENCDKYLSKGRPVFIEGYLKFSNWTTDDGQKRNKLDVVANTVQFLGSRSDSQGDSSIGKVPVPEDDVPF